jgi:carboxyl-terminal processing protease
MKKYIKVALPFIIVFSICLGILIGNFFVLNSIRKNVPAVVGKRGSFNKIDVLLDLINRNYVDTVNIPEMVEESIPHILKLLDPHSVYIPASELEVVNEDLEGSFTGIGVQFNIQNDTVMVVAVINGGPSEKVGILPGDRIVEINDSAFVGSKATNESVLKKLRGKKDTEVKVGIKRHNSKDILHFNITRGEIPVYSVDASYMIDNNTGYVKVNKFAMNTYEEFLNAITKLKMQGSKQLIIDLRGNPGGAMESAILMVNEFLSRGELIVYTEGRTIKRTDSYADGTGSFQNTKLVVLIDEWSASASEIFAGAIQDNDQGTIVGRRSFGKGLVQTQIPFPDSSAVRLTIARYYTPSGRSLQKPYVKGDESGAYENDWINRFNHGEFYNQDSIMLNDSLKYFTAGGRIVYGGGGIMPDIFVPRDTIGYSSYYNNLINHSLIYQFSFQYADDNRDKLNSYKNWKDLTAYLKTQDLIAKLAEFAEEKGVKKNIKGLRKSEKLIQDLLDAYITRIMLGENAFFAVLNLDDVMIQKALEVFEEK